MSKKQAERYNQGKPQWHLVDFPSLEPMVRVLEYGAKKYAPDNWKKGLPVKEICDSLLRHTFAFLDGQDNDEESGLPHIGHMQCNLLFLAYVMKNKSESFDDRTVLLDEVLSSIDADTPILTDENEIP